MSAWVPSSELSRPEPGTVWAPDATTVDLVVDGETWPLHGEGGWWSPPRALPVGARYGVRLDGADELLADPRSRWQPDGPEALSQVVAFADPAPSTTFRPTPWAEAVVYELHVGTFSPEGTFAGAAARLGHLVELGVTHVELMPVAGFAGAFGWGYDGVSLWSPHHAYGPPDALVGFVQRAHDLGLAVIVDVVLNHLGPVGNRLREFGPYFSDRYRTPWGDGFNLDGAGSDEVRDHLVGSALAWLRDYGADGLRVDAAHAFVDTSAVHVLEQLTASVDALAATTGRGLVMIAEWDRNDPRIVTPRQVGGHGFAAQWADDLHHALHATLTGERLGYYVDFDGGAEQVADAIRHGYVLRGQRSRHHGRRHGRDPGALAHDRFVVCAQNHDQVGNRAAGDRLHHLVGSSAALTAATLVLLGPGVPMLFQGEEWHASSPFPYVADAEGELADAIRSGRRSEFEAFGWSVDDIVDPVDPASAALARLDWDELDAPPHSSVRHAYATLIALRRSRAELAAGAPCEVQVHGEVVELVRGAIRVLANLGDTPAQADGGTALVVVGDVSCVVGDTVERVEIGPRSAVVVEGRVPERTAG